MINILGTLKIASEEMISLNLVVDISKASIVIEDKDFPSSMIACVGGKNGIYIRNGKQMPILFIVDVVNRWTNITNKPKDVNLYVKAISLKSYGFYYKMNVGETLDINIKTKTIGIIMAIG